MVSLKKFSLLALLASASILPIKAANNSMAMQLASNAWKGAKNGVQAVGTFIGNNPELSAVTGIGALTGAAIYGYDVAAPIKAVINLIARDPQRVQALKLLAKTGCDYATIGLLPFMYFAGKTLHEGACDQEKRRDMTVLGRHLRILLPALSLTAPLATLGMGTEQVMSKTGSGYLALSEAVAFVAGYIRASLAAKAEVKKK